MFRLHDRVRRRICIAGFFSLCVLPTTLVTLWGAVRHRSGAAAAEAQRLGSRLGVAMRLETVEHLRPGAVRYGGVEAADPETGRPLFRCRAIEARWSTTSCAAGGSRPVVALQFAQAELSAEAVERLRALLRAAMESDPAFVDFDARIAAPDLVIAGPDEQHVLRRVEGGVERLADGVQVEFSLRPACADERENVRVRIVRNRQASPPADGFEIDTGGAAMPCALMALALPGFAPLAPEGRFRGYLWASQSRGADGKTGYGGELVGQFDGVDLERLVAPHTPHRLTGRAQVAIQSARFRDGRIEQAVGVVDAGPGTVSRSLLAAAGESLNLVNALGGAALGLGDAEAIPYEQLAFGVVLGSSGVRLHGRCAAPGILMADRRQWLLAEPAQTMGPQPVAALIRALAPGRAGSIPATRQAEWLARHLPLDAAE